MPTILIDTVRVLDDVFIQIAEAAVGPAVPVDDVVEELWTALVRGDLRLAVEGGRLHVEPLPPPGTRGRGGSRRRGQAGVRLRLARAYRPIIEARQRVLEGQA